VKNMNNAIYPLRQPVITCSARYESMDRTPPRLVQCRSIPPSDSQEHRMHIAKRLAHRGAAALAATSLAVLGAIALDPAPSAAVRPPDIPSAATAQTELDDLTVDAEQNDGYDRSLFPHWSNVGNGCTAR